jgi:hypothetical protein
VEHGNTPFLVGHAVGTQNYICLLAPKGFAWTFFGPQATLFGDDGQQLTTHFLSANPDENGTLRATWQHSEDTSAIWAKAVASSTDPAYVAPGAIPWLKLQVVGVEQGPTGGMALFGTTFVQRVHTTGGIAPAAHGCANASDIGKKALVPSALLQRSRWTAWAKRSAVRKGYPDQAAVGLSVLRRVRDNRHRITGFECVRLPTGAQQHSRRASLDAPFRLASLAIRDHDLQPDVRIGELYFLDRSRNREFLVEIEVRERVMRNGRLRHEHDGHHADG